jgi:hypothetical protein
MHMPTKTFNSSLSQGLLPSPKSQIVASSRVSPPELQLRQLHEESKRSYESGGFKEIRDEAL